MVKIKATNLDGEIVNINISYNSNIILTTYNNINIIGYVSKILDRLAMEQLYYRKVRIKASVEIE